MTEPEEKKCDRPQARENTRDQDVISFVLTLIDYWLNKRHELILLFLTN